jgi:hypothetical protein
MPRAPENNPTDRILRILDEFNDLDAEYKRVCEVLARVSPAEFQKLPRTPDRYNVVLEQRYQQLMLARTRHSRDRMQQLRQTGIRVHRPSAPKPRIGEAPRRYRSETTFHEIEQKLAAPLHDVPIEKLKDQPSTLTPEKEKAILDQIAKEQEEFDPRVVDIPMDKNFRPGE